MKASFALCALLVLAAWGLARAQPACPPKCHGMCRAPVGFDSNKHPVYRCCRNKVRNDPKSVLACPHRDALACRCPNKRDNIKIDGPAFYACGGAQCSQCWMSGLRCANTRGWCECI